MGGENGLLSVIPNRSQGVHTSKPKQFGIYMIKAIQTGDESESWKSN